MESTEQMEASIQTKRMKKREKKKAREAKKKQPQIAQDGPSEEFPAEDQSRS